MRVLEKMLKAEADVLERVSGLPVNLAALSVMSNIWRVSQLMRQNIEQDVLKKHNLTWASFSTLFIVWIWEPIEMGAIAESQSVGRSTITSTVSLLEKRGLCSRDHVDGNRRSVVVTLTSEGKALVEAVFPEFNRHEERFASALTEDESEVLAGLLRKMIAHQDQQNDTTG